VTDELTPLLDRVAGWRGRARVLGALEGGITNRNFLVDVDGERFVLRLAGKDTHLLGIDREAERAANEQAAGLGIAPPVHAFLAPEGYLVTRFVEGAAIPIEAMREPLNLGRVAATLRAFHGSPAIAGVFDCFRIPETNARTATERGVRVPVEYDRAIEVAHRIERAFTADPEPPVPCHNDLLNANFLLDATAHDGQERMWLLDWEYAGMNDRLFDLGNFATNNELDGEAEHGLLTAYFGASSDRRRARLALMKVMSDLREAMWGVVQQGVSTLDFDYVDYADRHFDRLLRNAGAPGFDDLLAAAARPEVPGVPARA
jgi:thiamine kinase-like enzyme